MNGDDGVDRVENNLGAADDNSTLSVENGRVRYDRDNGPFNLSIGTQRVLRAQHVRRQRHADTTPGLGALIAVTVDAGSGDDKIAGGDEADTFFGGLGNDTLDGGAGADAVDGQDGDDTLTPGTARPTSPAAVPGPTRRRSTRSTRWTGSRTLDRGKSGASAIALGKNAQAPAQERRLQRQGRRHLRRHRARGLQGHARPADLRQGKIGAGALRPGPPGQRALQPQGRPEEDHHDQARQGPAAADQEERPQGQGAGRLARRAGNRRPARPTCRSSSTRQEGQEVVREGSRPGGRPTPGRIGPRGPDAPSHSARRPFRPPGASSSGVLPCRGWPSVRRAAVRALLDRPAADARLARARDRAGRLADRPGRRPRSAGAARPPWASRRPCSNCSTRHKRGCAAIAARPGARPRARARSRLPCASRARPSRARPAGGRARARAARPAG